MYQIFLSYDSFSESEEEYFTQAFHDHFGVEVKHLTSICETKALEVNLATTSLPVVKIVLSILAGGIGTIGLKKIIELITEDLYEFSKKFFTDLFKTKETDVNVKLSFILNGTTCVGETSTNDNFSFEDCIQVLPQLYNTAKKIISSNLVPKGTVLINLETMYEDNPKIICHSSQFSIQPDVLNLEFDKNHKAWRLVRLYYSDSNELYSFFSDNLESAKMKIEEIKKKEQTYRRG